MEKILVESQWNGKQEMMINIPNFPHLHSSLTYNVKDCKRYPHPYEYFLSALSGIITLIIKDYSNINCLLITNLYISIYSNFDSKNNISKISIDINLDSSASPEEFSKLQKEIYNNNLFLNLLNNNNILQINWN